MWSWLISTVVAATIVSVASPPGMVEDQIFKGKVISVAAAKLTVSDPAGQIMQSFSIPVGTNVTLNGKSAALMELMMGDMVTITMDGQKVKSVVAMRNIKVH